MPYQVGKGHRKAPLMFRGYSGKAFCSSTLIRWRICEL